jgi:hypothetical protein
MPLAHILAPQIARKVKEIKTDLGPARGYLAVSDPAPMTAADKAAMAMRNKPKRAPEDVARDLAIAKQMQQEKTAKALTLIPNAPSPTPAPTPTVKKKKGKAGFLRVAPGEIIGTTESGVPIYADTAKKGFVPAPAAGQPFATNERGEAIDRRGKNLGYLPQPGVRTLDRRPSDVSLGKQEMHDVFAVDVIQRRYAEHLKAMQENRDADGYPTDKFPQGYFSGKSAAERKDIVAGVQALKEIERGTRY